MYKHTTVANK